MNTHGFIILRHMNDEKSSNYWLISYNNIRKYYSDNIILIIDDNSKKEFINLELEKKLHNTIIINSEFEGRGEILPYYYYLKNKLFDTACIIHDSVFINSNIDFDIDKYQFLWNFGHTYDQIEDEEKMINVFNNNELIEFYKNKDLWCGCFGCMMIIEYDFLKIINDKYDLSLLLDYVKTRYNRMSLERVLACIFQSEYKMTCLLNDINNYCPFGLTIDKIEYVSHLPIIKVWSYR